MFSTILFHTNWKSGPIFTMADTLILRPCDQKAWTNIVFCANWYSFESLVSVCLNKPSKWHQKNDHNSNDNKKKPP